MVTCKSDRDIEERAEVRGTKVGLYRPLLAKHVLSRFKKVKIKSRINWKGRGDVNITETSLSYLKS